MCGIGLVPSKIKKKQLKTRDREMSTSQSGKGKEPQGVETRKVSRLQGWEENPGKCGSLLRGRDGAGSL